ncbi:glycoside hydrolase family 32 protein [Olegusella massiliensis]|uniref:glycoside hydrolase family 32 protein n=1 Tax=Olegusella massiliensis TaxID=1776381 RepID=UPI00405575DF
MSDESWRPKLHLAPYKGSISDPNGLCQFRGTYHICCQNAPEYPGNFDSPHGWGHYVSRDLINWVFLGCQVMPDCPSDKDGSYSGGAYIATPADGAEHDGEVWYYYTGNVRLPEGDGTLAGRLANQTRMRSYNGIHMGPKEVILDNSDYPAYCSNHVRDPKVWKQNNSLHMLLGARTRNDSRGAVLCYRSDNGAHWELEGSVTNTDSEPFGYMWECPDRITLTDTQGTVHEFLATCPQGTDELGLPYMLQNVHGNGYFPIDGSLLDLLHQDHELMRAQAPHPAIDQTTFVEWDHGFDYYACQSFIDDKNRTLLIGWMSLPHDKNDVRPYDNPTDTWRGCLTVPRELTLNAEGHILQNPVAEIDSLRGEVVPLDGASATIPKVSDLVISSIAGDGTLRFDEALELRFSNGEAELIFTDDTVGQGRKVRRTNVDALHDIRVIMDTSVFEIFINGGETVFGTRYFTEADSVHVSMDFPEAQACWYPMSPISINYVVDR